MHPRNNLCHSWNITDIMSATSLSAPPPLLQPPPHPFRWSALTSPFLAPTLSPCTCMHPINRQPPPPLHTPTPLSTFNAPNFPSLAPDHHLTPSINQQPPSTPNPPPLHSPPPPLRWSALTFQFQAPTSSPCVQLHPLARQGEAPRLHPCRCALVSVAERGSGVGEQ